MISVVTVHLNDLARLSVTAASVGNQAGQRFEWIIKDGSAAPAPDRFSVLPPHKWLSSSDKGIYHAMNLGLDAAKGELVHFLNCGDEYWTPDTLALVWAQWISAGRPDIIYGNIFDKNEGAIVKYPRTISEFYLFRRTVCHQAMFYKTAFIKRLGGFCTEFKICADNEFLVRSIVEYGARMQKMEATVISYGAGGVSSSLHGMRQGVLEVRAIRRRYFTAGKRHMWTLVMAATLPQVRSALISRFRGKSIAKAYRKVANLING